MAEPAGCVNRLAAAPSARLRRGERILFIDRDGTVIEEPPDEQVDSLAKIELVPGVIPALLRLRDAGLLGVEWID